MGLIIRSSAIHAAGCYTTTAIRKGARLAEYDGQRISKDKADKAYEDCPVTYLFGLGKGDVVIDGHCTAMFINHSCNANSETDVKKGRVWITALRNIKAGEEITYDYHLYDGDDSDDAICNCGAKNCRGSMYAPEELKKRKAAKRKAEQKARQKRARAKAKKKRQ